MGAATGPTDRAARGVGSRGESAEFTGLIGRGVRRDPSVASISTVMTRASEADDAALVAALRGGDESAFADLVDLHTAAMLRAARIYVPSREIAEEVVQETWIAVLRGIVSFESRSSLRTWLFAVLTNVAKRRGLRERRHADLAMLAFTGGVVDPARIRASGLAYSGHWRTAHPLVAFPDTPEGFVLGNELIAVARRELDRLPERQRAVVTLRDMLGLEAADACALLEISTANQRVLLHRGRAAIREALEDYLTGAV